MDPVEVFCRIRPPNPPGSQVCISIADDRHVTLTPPDSVVSRNAKVKPTTNQFTHVFDPLCDQKEVFDRVSCGLVGDLVTGKNGLLFAYGVTGSGKTYTMTGNPTDAGVLPRTLDVLFNSITQFLAPKSVFYPDGANAFDIRSEGAASIARQMNAIKEHGAERIAKTPGKADWRGNQQTRRLYPNLDDIGRNGAGGSSNNKENRVDENWEIIPREKELGRVTNVDEDNAYAVFVSYVEIYNNYVYDLLEPNNELGQNMSSKNLREDVKRMSYVNDVTEVEVRSTEEAFQQFIKGQAHRRIAHTELNRESSRSHSVFNIRLIQAPLDADGVDVIQDKHKTHVSQLSLVDLAGSERSDRTGNKGDRMRETGNINKSLLSLRLCMEQLRENQKLKKGDERMVPYRDSRLTHLFKNYFDGEGRVRMIVCTNPSSADFDENVHVMSFAEMTQEVEVQRAHEVDIGELAGLAPGRRRAAKFHKQVAADLANVRIRHDDQLSRHLSAFDTLPTLTVDGPDDTQSIDSLINFISDRMQKRGNFSEICLSQGANTVENIDKFVVAAETNRHALDEVELELMKAAEENDRLYSDNRKVGQENRHLLVRLKKYEADAQLLANQENARKRTEEKLRSELRNQDERFQKVKQVIGVPGSSRVNSSRINSTRTKTLERINAYGSMDSVADDMFTKSKTIAGTSHGGNRTMAVSSSVADPRGRSRVRRIAPSPPPRSQKMMTVNGAPVVNPRGRNRRSKSAGVVIDHQPSHKVPGQIMQPSLGGSSSKRTVKPKSGELNKADGYALTHQDIDSDGNVRTSVFKGGVHGTAGGGSAVIFEDVEQVTHRTPVKRSSFEDHDSSTSSKRGRV